MKTLKHMILCAAALLSACGPQDNKDTYVIDGKLGTTEFDGEWMYLVPLKNDKGRVDSVRIKDGAFSFKGDSAEMKVLRVHYLLRGRLQELLVATEPGHISVVIDSVSSGGGTPQNDALQQWKEELTAYNGRMSALAAEYRQASPADTAQLRQRRDSLYIAHKEYCHSLADDMRGTAFGDFLNELFPR